MNSLIQHHYLHKELYCLIMEPVCKQYDLNMAELLILIFVYDNPEHNTASDIVSALKLAKSHVSISIRTLEDRGYIQCFHENGNRRSVRLKYSDSAIPVIAYGKDIQNKYFDILFTDFSDNERSLLYSMVDRLNVNAQNYVRESYQ